MFIFLVFFSSARNSSFLSCLYAHMFQGNTKYVERCRRFAFPNLLMFASNKKKEEGYKGDFYCLIDENFCVLLLTYIRCLLYRTKI